MIKKGLISTIMNEDQRYYNKKADTLDSTDDGVIIENQKNLILFNSTLNKIYENNFENDRELLGNISMLLSINEDLVETTAAEFESDFETLAQMFHSKLDYYISSAQALIQNLNYVIQNQKILPNLIRQERFQYITKIIEQINYPYVFPFDKNTLNINILNDISEIQYALRNGIFQIEIKTGLVEPEYYPLFEIQSFAAPQILAKREAGFLYIRPQKPHIIVNKIGHHLLHEDELIGCNKLNSTRICPMRQFLFTDEGKCESDLLRRSYAVNWTMCDIRMEKDNTPKFIKLKTSNSWLYSTQGPLKLLTRCDGTSEEGIIIQGTGYINTTKTCTLRQGISSMEITYDTSPSKLIIPEINLEIQHLSESLKNEIGQRLFYKLMITETQDSFWQLERDLRKQIKNIKTQNDNGLIFYIFACLIIASIVITIIIVIFLCIFKNILSKTPDTVKVRLVPTQDNEDETHRATIDFK